MIVQTISLDTYDSLIREKYSCDEAKLRAALEQIDRWSKVGMPDWQLLNLIYGTYLMDRRLWC